jgi:spore germination protein KC
MITKSRLIGLILFTLFLSGCWDRIEINERSNVIGIGIDKAQEDQSLVSAQIINPRTSKNDGGDSNQQQSPSSTNAVVIETSQGKSFYDAIRNFSKYTPRKMAFFHNRVIIFGNEMAKAGITGILDELVRDYQFRATNWIFVAEKTAQAVLETNTGIGNYPAKEIDQMMLTLTRNAFILPVNRNDFIYHLKSESKTAFAPLIQIKASGPTPASQIEIDKTAVFKNDRLIGFLTHEESAGLLWLNSRVKGDSLVFPFYSHDVSVEIMDGTTRVIPRTSGGELHMKILCTGEAILRESENIRNTPETITRLENQTAKILERKLKQTIHKAQQMKADFLSFAQVIHRERPEIWQLIERDWENYFPRIKTEIAFKIKITGFGITKNSLNTIGGE